MKKKLFILTVIAFCMLLAACSSETDDTQKEIEETDHFNKEGFPIVDEPITLNFLSGKFPTTADDYNDVTVWKEYNNMTNINIEWGLVLQEGLDEKRNLALGGGQLPDVFYSTFLPNDDLIKYGDQGVFVALNDLIKEYMPNLTKVLEENPEIEKGITFPDGNIYGLPTIYDPDFSSLLMGGKPWINKKWLDQLEMDLPETTDEFYDFLTAVKKNDLNDNGKDDEIPFGGVGIGGLKYILSGSFGLNLNGVQHMYVDVDSETSEMRFIPTDPRYKEMLEYMHKLYSEGLIDESIFTIDRDKSYAIGAEGRYGSVFISSPETIYGEEGGGNYIGMPPLEGPHGDRKYMAIRSPLVDMGGFSVTSENDHIPETLRWMDYFYSDEGAKMYFMGKEGVTYKETEEGEVEYLDEILDNDNGLSMEQNLKPHITWLGGGYPGIVKHEFFKGAESKAEGVEAAEKIEPYLVEDILPAFTFTAEESKRKSALGTDIEKYVEESMDNFIIGEKPFSEWDDYVNTIEKMGLEEYMEIEKAAYERYKSH